MNKLKKVFTEYLFQNIRREIEDSLSEITRIRIFIRINIKILTKLTIATICCKFRLKMFQKSSRTQYRRDEGVCFLIKRPVSPSSFD